MSKNFPKFRIYAVVDGKNRGLLAERHASEKGPIETVYFYLENGLKPTQEILKVCDYNDKCLYTVDDREERILNEIISYAVNVASHGIKGAFEFTQKYAERRGYQEVVDRYYEDERKSPFKDFFESASTLKKHVLRNLRGKLHLAEGMAEEFRLLSPHNIVVDDFKYIRPIEEVLRVSTQDKPQWFRKTGPIACDFEDDRIYRRAKLLMELKRLVLNNTFFLLEGVAATGKTVLVRQLSYELYENDKWAVYYFDCGLKRDFDPTELIRDVNSVKGIFVLENIHLETRKFQRVYAEIQTDPHRHIIFTGRPSFRISLYKKDEDLGEIESLKLEPFDNVDEIIDHYASHHSELPWPAKARKSVKDVSRESFWLLSYALKGYVKAKGGGGPKDWAEEGVRDDLSDLEKVESCFPEVLVAISPLYQNEVLTEEYYLTNVLDFSQATLNELVYCGEITRQETKEGYVFYGLPHSALATLYWEHGKTYRRRKGLHESEDVIYDYAVSEVPNGLEFTLCYENTSLNRFKSIVKRLVDEGKLLTAVARDRFMAEIATTVWYVVILSDDPPNPIKIEPEFLNLLARKIDETEDVYYIPFCIAFLQFSDRNKLAYQQLWQLLDHKKLANKLSRHSNIRSLAHSFMEFNDCFLDEMRAICELLNLENLAQGLRQTDDIINKCCIISEILQANMKIGTELWRRLADKQDELVHKLGQAKDIKSACRGIREIFILDKSSGWQLWDLLGKSESATEISEGANLDTLRQILNRLIQEDKKAGEEICRLLHCKVVADGFEPN